MNDNSPGLEQCNACVLTCVRCKKDFPPAKPPPPQTEQNISAQPQSPPIQKITNTRDPIRAHPVAHVSLAVAACSAFVWHVHTTTQPQKIPRKETVTHARLQTNTCQRD